MAGTGSIPPILPLLDTGIPQIVITEASPMNSPGKTIPNLPAPDLPSDSVPVEFVTAVVSPGVSGQISDPTDSSSSEEEYSAVLCAAPESTDCKEQSTVPVAESTAQVLERAPIRRPSTETLWPHNVRNEEPTGCRCCQAYGRCAWYYYQCSQLIDSKYGLLLWVVLLALPISFGFLGARYLMECKQSPGTPVLLFIIGITSLITLTSKIILILHKTTWEQQIGVQFLKSSIVTTFYITLLMFLTEIMTFMQYTPVFDITSPDYCDPFFYNFTYWINWIALLVLLLMFLFRLPKCWLTPTPPL